MEALVKDEKEKKTQKKLKRTRKKEKKTQKRGWDRKREEDGQKNDQKCLKFRRDLAEGKRNVQHQKHRSALRALKN